MIVLALKRKLNMEDDEDGWKWLVVLAAFMVQFIVCGITYSIGIFHAVFQEVFDHDHFDTSWTGSILLYVTALTSVVLRCVMSKFGPRFSVMLGGLFAAAGLGLGMFVQEIYQVYLTFGLLTGIGFGLACTPSIVAVEQHFTKNRFQALSVVVGGIGAGIVTFPFIIRELLTYVAWRGTLLILAGIALNLCVCGALMTPLNKSKEVHLLPLLSSLPLRNILFHGMCIANLFWSFGSTIIYMYIPSYAIDEGTQFETAAFLISVVGIAGLMARMIFAFMGHNSAIDDMTAILCSVFLAMVVTGICPLLFDDIAGQIGYCLLFGFLNGYWTTYLSQVSRELVGPEYIALGNGYLSFCIALGSLLGGPCAGLLIQEEFEYKYAFYLAGGCLLWSSIVMVLFKYQRFNVPSQKEEDEQETTDQKSPLVEYPETNNKDTDSIPMESVVTSSV